MSNRWLILLLLFLSRLAMGFQFQSIGSVSVQLSKDIGFSNTEIGALIGIFMLPGVFLAFPSGLLGRWLSDKLIVAAGLLCLSIGGIVVFLSADLLLMSVGRFICGAGFVLSTVYFTKMTIDWFQGRELATALSILIVSWPGGIALSQVIHPYIAVNFGWQWAISAASIFCLVAVFAISVLYRVPLKELAEANSQAQTKHLTSWEWLKTSVAAWSWSFYNAGYLVFLSFAARALQESGISNSYAANTVGAASFLTMISILTGGFVADKFNISRSVILLSSSVAALTLLTISFGYSPIILCCIFGAIGMSSGGIIIALSGQAMAPERRAYGMGVYQTWFFLLSAPAPLVGGWLYDLTGRANTALMFGASLFALSGVFYFTFLKINARN
jgi:predicted MFS family arabinose efflux permease